MEENRANREKTQAKEAHIPLPQVAPWIVAALALLLLSYLVASFVSIPAEIHVEKDTSPASAPSPFVSPP